LHKNTDYKLVPLFQFFHQGSSFRIFHEEKYVELILKVTVKLDDIGVGEAVVDLQLLEELLFHFILDQGAFEYFFDSVGGVCRLVLADVDISEFS
jgi:hypothetical protein